MWRRSINLTTGTEEEAAEAYDIAAIKFRGLNAVTNFDMTRYDVKAILESNTLPIGGGAAKRLKEAQAIESSRKRDEMISLGSAFQYGSASSVGPLQAYPLMQTHPFETQPLLSLQNHDHLSQYSNQESSSHYQSYIQTQLQLHQQQQQYNNLNSNTTQFYGNYVQNNPVLLHGLMNNMGGPSSSVMDQNGSSSGSYSGGFLGDGLGMGLSSGSGHVGAGSAEELAMVKVDYDHMSSDGGGGGATYTGWSGETVEGSNPGVFTMWNDWDIFPLYIYQRFKIFVILMWWLTDEESREVYLLVVCILFFNLLLMILVKLVGQRGFML